jgi:phage gp29-like protein
MAEKLTLLQKAVKAYNVLANPIGGNSQRGDAKTNLNRSIAPAQLTRLRHDIGMWRIAIAEAEQAYYPHRVKMQTMFVDTVLNGHVASCIERRKDLTLLRDFELLDSKGNEIEGLEDIFDTEWFNKLVSYALDGLFYGYSLIALNDLIDSSFPELTIVKRQNVSPDRCEVTRYIYAQNGDKFLEEPFSKWHIWVRTPTDTGQSSCGYGLLYKVALYEIYLRNTIGYNADFVELYSQPYRVGKTTKTDETERALMEQALQQMGSSGYALIDPNDEIMFLETALGGTGWKGYENLEMRCEQKISKLILGHADALDSVPGKLGTGNGEESPAYLALIDKQTKDGKFIENVVNGQLIPKMRALGFNLPEGIVFRFSNNAETEEVKNKQIEYAGKLADVAVKLKQAGMGMDEQHFTLETGIPVFVDMAQLKGIEVDESKLKMSAKAKMKLKNLYR